ncbi:hypothetical protein AMTR_s00143p00054770 [Amborella trichopoda]|uniref:Nitroreductase domain-containing protein n=2 Tax=Amborella trichopoda TaxID=13333 RepID=W1P7X5_AMBTC|nr:hypothetical protein AMTR_s00143p00054770 [Amborella trichopoda]
MPVSRSLLSSPHPTPKSSFHLHLFVPPPSTAVGRGRGRGSRSSCCCCWSTMSPPRPSPESSSSSLLSSSSSSDDDKNGVELVKKYHNQTKHSLSRYASGPHGLDWANQPNPFRRYISAPLLHPHNQTQLQLPHYPSLFRNLPLPSLLSLFFLSLFLFNSLALSAWKTTGFSTWSLRVNPSSGNLHPTEAYILSPPLSNLSPTSHFVAHYAPKEHALELRANAPSRLWEGLPNGSFFVGLSSIFWRQAWKYGERAFRYCNHDVGHAIAALVIAAASLGCDARLLDGLGQSHIRALMGLPDHPTLPTTSRPVKGCFSALEHEHPDCLVLLFPASSPEFSANYASMASAISKLSASSEWKGKPNSLSKEHVYWDIIYSKARLLEKPPRTEEGFHVPPFRSSPLFNENSYKALTIGEVVRKRRSAVDMGRSHVMHRKAFYQILLHYLPSGSCSEGKQGEQFAMPFRVLPWKAQLHLAILVHRVAGLVPGLYFMVRNEEHSGELKRAMRPGFEWVRPEGCPTDLPLYRLAVADCRELAKIISCHQDIASDGCFSLGMVAHFEQALHGKNVWMYPRLFWESGIIGQVLYLEAHAVGISATGIGCYFDDAVHDVLGLSDAKFQSLYHFTMGSPVIDGRIMNLLAYPGPEIDA